MVNIESPYQNSDHHFDMGRCVNMNPRIDKTGIMCTDFDMGTAQSLTHIKTEFIPIPGNQALTPKRE
jgi:hypothetical protein